MIIMFISELSTRFPSVHSNYDNVAFCLSTAFFFFSNKIQITNVNVFCKALKWTLDIDEAACVSGKNNTLHPVLNMPSVMVLYLLGILPGPVDVVAPGDDDWKLPTDQQSTI